ncbi:hypothetical protein NHQ30_005731 [Ciborinia camelliae]|nr:hypothetical protein NHQ30_005731 [Ciborinia camelliae]
MLNPLPRTKNAIGTAEPRALHHAMDTLKSMSGFTPTTAGQMILSQGDRYISSQNHNLQPAVPQSKVSYGSQQTPNSTLDTVQFHEDDFSDDDNIDLDTNYALPMSQSSFTHSQPQSQPGVHSQYRMPPPTQIYDWASSPSSSYQGYPTMSQGSYTLANPTPRPPLATLSNNEMSPPSSTKIHTPDNTKDTIKSKMNTSNGAFNSSLAGFGPSRATPRPSTAASSSSTNVKTEHTKQSDVPYLSYYEMEQMYSTSSQNPQNEKEKLARRKWLAELGIDVMPFNLVLIDQLQIDKVEIHWALKSPETRREIEQKAIRLKQPYHHIHKVPLRLAPFAMRTPVPIKLIGPVPLPFSRLEQTYFNIPERRILAYHDLVPKRLSWLKELGLDDPRYLPLAQTPLEQQALDNLHDKIPRVERRAIEAKAKYINAMLNPPNPSWETLEKTYEIYPATAFTVYAAYINKRRQWLHQLSLDVAPFCYKTLELPEGSMQGMEVAWSTMYDVERNKILETAKTIKQDNNPVLNSWTALEDVYGFTKEKEKEFKNDPTGYIKKREYWIIDIGLNVDPFKNPQATPISLQEAWSQKPIAERKTIVDKARYEKERYVRDLARKKLEKAGDNYKAPPSEIKKSSKGSSAKKSSGNKISKSSDYRSSRYGSARYTGRSTTFPNSGYFAYGYSEYGRYQYR